MLCSSHLPLVHQGWVFMCVLLGGRRWLYKIILNYTFVTWNTFYLLCMSSGSLINSAIPTFQLLIMHQTSTSLSFLSMSSPIQFLSSFPWSFTFQGFHLNVLMYVCLPGPVATEANFSSGIQHLTAHIGCQSPMLANNDRTIRGERDTLLCAIYLAGHHLYQHPSCFVLVLLVEVDQVPSLKSWHITVNFFCIGKTFPK